MTYEARADGYLRIEPPLDWFDIKESGFHLENQSFPNGRYPTISLTLEQVDSETRTGFTRSVTAALVEPERGGGVDFRKLGDDVKALVEEMTPLGRKVSGQILVRPVYSGDGGTWRVVVDEEGVREEFARHQWPDGTEVNS